MTNDNVIDNTKGILAGTNAGSVSPKEIAPKTDSKTDGVSQGNTVTQKDFLTLLVNQLQNQDPLNPMKSEDFAVQLAQFTQVEQLIGVNKRLDQMIGSDSGPGPIGSLAAYLGQEVALSNQRATISGGEGPNTVLDIPADAQSARIDLVDEKGVVVGSKQLEDFDSGQNVVALSGLDVPSGSYEVRAVAVDSSGRFEELDPKLTGTVEGFVLEPAPALIVDGAEVPLTDVKEVYKGKS